MAKEKKPASPKSAAEKPAAKKPAAKKPAKAEKAAGGAPQAPLIDTGLAASTAAAMVANRLAGAAASGPSSGASSVAPQESSGFKNFKENLNKPSTGSLGGILGTGGGKKKFGASFGGPKQTGPGTGGGRNQTFGADVNRTGVPRRTSG